MPPISPRSIVRIASTWIIFRAIFFELIHSQQYMITIISYILSSINYADNIIISEHGISLKDYQLMKTHFMVRSRGLGPWGLGINFLPSIVKRWTQMTWFHFFFVKTRTPVLVGYVTSFTFDIHSYYISSRQNPLSI